MLRKRYIIETINNMLKNMAQIVHSRHRSVNDFIMNLISALGAYVTEGVSKRCILFFYKQNPDFHKPGLCHVQKNLYL